MHAYLQINIKSTSCAHIAHKGRLGLFLSLADVLLGDIFSAEQLLHLLSVYLNNAGYVHAATPVPHRGWGHGRVPGHLCPVHFAHCLLWFVLASDFKEAWAV